MASSRLIFEGQKERQFGEAPRLGRSRDGGWRGKLEYLVDTSNQLEAIIGSGVPGLGAAYATPEVPPITGLICVAQDFEYIARGDGPDGVGAISKVVNIYAEVGAGGTLPAPVPGQKFTVLSLQTETQTVMFDRRSAMGGQFAEPMANGDGFGRKYGSITASVYVYLPLSSLPNLSRLIRLARHKKLNSDAVSLPVVAGTQVTLGFGPRQVMYEGFTHEVKNQLIEFRHELSMQDDFDFIWGVENEQGNHIADAISEIYDDESFAGLW